MKPTSGFSGLIMAALFIDALLFGVLAVLSLFFGLAVTLLLAIVGLLAYQCYLSHASLQKMDDLAELLFSIEFHTVDISQRPARKDKGDNAA